MQPFTRVLDEAFGLCTVQDAAQFGPFSAQLFFADEAERVAWMSSLLRASAGLVPAFSVAVAPPRRPALDAIVPPDVGTEAVVFEDGDVVALWMPSPTAVLFVFDRLARRGLLYPAKGKAPPWTYSRPLLPIVHAALLESGWAPVHAAAVGRNSRFLALAGAGGVGKSTAALACAAAGWEYAGDDFVLVHAETAEVAPLFTSARLRFNPPPPLDALARRTSIAVTNLNGDLSYEMRLAEHWPNRIHGGDVAAWLLPKRNGAPRPTFTPAGRLAAYRSLIVVTTAQLPFGRQATSANILRMIGRAPAFEVDTGTDPTVLPDIFDRFLAELAA